MVQVSSLFLCLFVCFSKYYHYDLLLYHYYWFPYIIFSLINVFLLFFYLYYHYIFFHYVIIVVCFLSLLLVFLYCLFYQFPFVVIVCFLCQLISFFFSIVFFPLLLSFSCPLLLSHFILILYLSLSFLDYYYHLLFRRFLSLTFISPFTLSLFIAVIISVYSIFLFVILYFQDFLLCVGV